MKIVPCGDKERKLTCLQVSELYAVSIETVRRWVRNGAVGVVLVGPFRLIRIPQSEADKHFTRLPSPNTLRNIP